MRTNTPAVSKRLRSPTPDRFSKSQLFGPPSSPPPSRTYGRKGRNRPRPLNTPPRHPTASTSTPLRRNDPVASSSDTPSRRLRSSALHYQEPVVPTTSSSSSNLRPCSEGSSDASRVKPDITTLEIDDKDDPVFPSTMNLPVHLKPSRDHELREDLYQAQVDLKNALENAMTNIKVLMDATEARNECPCCLEVMLQPFILSCGHTFCKECLIRLSDIYIKAKMNFACPDCRTIQGRFTPIPNYSSQRSVDQMLEMKGTPIPTRQPLQWPRAFQSGPPASLPFPPSIGTYPVSVPIIVSAPFSVTVNDD
ncbi:hypothetical protein F5876DRAFT_83088 [Lentinula aff. lateritia]|uniref:Uncharacterized protein n=1 Tax=Lentinula aff. lateritia TaxID=2804960 RepID=A0ACC1TIH6_9AGAR|nr:hypothetical protein F5876DRAFT_83088 [Lentinula aff. lateritia]